MGASRLQAVLLMAATVGLLLVPVLSPEELGEESRGVHGVAAGLTLLLATTLTAEAFTGERQRRTMEALLTTPLTLPEIFVGKLLASLLAAAAGPILLLAQIPLLAAAHPEAATAPGFLASHLALTAFVLSIALFAVVTAVWAALLCGTVRAAMNLHSGLLLLPLVAILAMATRIPEVAAQVSRLDDARRVGAGSVVLAGLAVLLLRRVFRRFRVVAHGVR